MTDPGVPHRGRHASRSDTELGVPIPSWRTATDAGPALRRRADRRARDLEAAGLGAGSGWAADAPTSAFRAVPSGSAMLGHRSGVLERVPGDTGPLSAAQAQHRGADDPEPPVRDDRSPRGSAQTPGDDVGSRAGDRFPAGPSPLPPRPSGVWSRMPPRADLPDDEDRTEASALTPPPPGAVDRAPHLPPAAAPAPDLPDDSTDAHGFLPPEWDDSTGGLEVIGDHVEDEAPRRGRLRRGDRAGRRRSPVAVVLSLIALAGLVAGIVLGGQKLIEIVNPPAQDFSGAGSGSVEVRVEEGDTLSDIARRLVDAGVIASVGAFVDAAEAEPDAMGILPGVYSMREEMSGQAALDLMLQPGTRMISRVTVPEGLTLQATLQRIAEVTGTPLADLEAAAADPAAVGAPAYAHGQLEGFLFPATYEFEPGDTAVDMLRAMTARFAETAADLQLEQRAAAAGRSPYEIVVVASMIQSETRLDPERPAVAQVIYNRLGRGMPLGIDATLAYGLDKNGNELTVADLQADHLYNTRTRVGLPPTPISAPGEASLEAALAPSAGDLLYYVLESSDGSHFFTADPAQFEAARQRCADAGLGCGG